MKQLSTQKKKEIFFCLEPLSKKEKEFITSFEEDGELVKKVNHDNFRLHLTSKVFFNQDLSINSKIKKYRKIIKHVHVGDQNLAEPGTINKIEHCKIGEALRNINYDGYITLEMKRNLTDIEGSIRRGVEFIKKNYIVR